jgi:PAS domain S-box-containing protein
MDQTTSNILIVDDSEMHLALLKNILKEVNANVYMANSGSEALRLIDENRFALAVLDIQMPEMDGFELASRIRNLHGLDLIPIIFLTGYNTDDVQVFNGYNHGAIDYLTKPVNKIIFISKVKIFLELDRQKRNLITSKELLQKSKLELEKKQEQLTAQNIALQKAKEETEESRKKYIELFDFAPIGFFSIDREGKIKQINVKGSQLFGFESAQIIDFNFHELISANSLPDFERFLTQVFDGKVISGCELMLNSINGKTIFIHLEGSIIDKKQTCLLSMADITERKAAQMALKASEELYHSLLKTSPDGIIITDLGGRITEASDIAFELFGIQDRKMVEGMRLMEFIPKLSRKALVEIMSTTIREGMVQNFEIKLKRIDHTEFTSEISTSQIKGNNGETIALMSVIRDISERKLFEKQLRHSERMTGIGELATGMAHEINQPLNTISLSIDNIIYSIDNKTITEPYLKTKINKVFDNITRIKKIIDHVRTFSRDQDDFVQASFEINTSIQNSISMISEQFSHKEINLSFRPDKNIPPVIGNAYRFEQVMLNMLINAKDAVEEKGKKGCGKSKKKVEILTKLENKQIIVEVKDNGIGIAPEDVDKVLLPFFTTKAPGQGTGLGLSISYGIIKELGGDIEILSKIQSGTTISIKIPVQENTNKKYTLHHVQ